MESDYVFLHPPLVVSPASPPFIISLSLNCAAPHEFLPSLCPHLTLSESFFARQLPTGSIPLPRDCFLPLSLSLLRIAPPLSALILCLHPI